MENNYCKLFTDLIKKYDILGLIDEKSCQNICQRLKYISKLLNKCYNYIFIKGYSKSQAISKIMTLENDNKQIFTEKEANDIYEKFITISQRGGSSLQKTILEKDKKDIMRDTQQSIKDNVQLQEDLKDIDLVNKERLEKEKTMFDNEQLSQISQELKNQENLIRHRKQDLKLKKLGISNLKNKLKQLKKNKEIKKHTIGKYYSEYKHQKDKYLKFKNKVRENKQKMNSLKKNYLKTENQLVNSYSKEGDKMTQIRNQVVKKDMDMIEIMLITLSLLPIAGWTFDLPLFIYAILKKRYNLAIITVLNWYIWGFWLLFGLNVNMGPSMKVTYLGNKQNYMKNGILTNFNNDKKILNPYTQVHLTNLNGKKYAIDKFNNVYQPLISNPKIIGVIDPETGELVKKSSKKFFETVDKNKNSR